MAVEQWCMCSYTCTYAYRSSRLLWAACCLAFFGFLRCGEFTIPTVSAFDSARHLSLSDVAVDSYSNHSVLAVILKASKTDQFGIGATLFLGKAVSELCPVVAVVRYLAIQAHSAGPLFVRADGQPLTRKWFVDKTQVALARAGINASAYNGHSFRIGAATTAAACGVSDSKIKTLL